jgi:hypothetical protein
MGAHASTNHYFRKEQLYRGTSASRGFLSLDFSETVTTLTIKTLSLTHTQSLSLSLYTVPVDIILPKGVSWHVKLPTRQTLNDHDIVITQCLIRINPRQGVFRHVIAILGIFHRQVSQYGIASTACRRRRRRNGVYGCRSRLGARRLSFRIRVGGALACGTLV